MRNGGIKEGEVGEDGGRGGRGRRERWGEEGGRQVGIEKDRCGVRQQNIYLTCLHFSHNKIPYSSRTDPGSETQYHPAITRAGRF